VELRCLLLLPLDDLLVIVREFKNPDVSHAGLDRCLHRHGVSNLRESVKPKNWLIRLSLGSLALGVHAHLRRSK